MFRGASPLAAAILAVALALSVSAAWCLRPRTAAIEPTVDTIVSVRVTPHDDAGVPAKPVMIRDPVRVRALVAALGVDAQPPIPCPSDYATAAYGLVLSGRDVYARRNVYVWSPDDAPRVLVSRSDGCRGGPPADAAALRAALLPQGGSREGPP